LKSLVAELGKNLGSSATGNEDSQHKPVKLITEEMCIDDQRSPKKVKVEHTSLEVRSLTIALERLPFWRNIKKSLLRLIWDVDLAGDGRRRSIGKRDTRLMLNKILALVAVVAINILLGSICLHKF
jgi:hypothetical protein